MYQGIFIDDQKADEHFAKLMSTPGKNGLTVKFQQPTEFITLANQIVESQPAFVALDYRLDEDRNTAQNVYKAEPLAQQLRSYTSENVDQDFPIILVSHENKITGFDNDITAHNLFDCRFTKKEVASEPEHRQQILSLVKGYQRMIKNWRKKSERWATFFALNKEESVVVAYQAIRELDKLKAPHQVAQQILRYVIERQGILLDQDNVLARLGVAKAGNDIEPLFARLKKDKVIYSGVFSEGWTRWWQHRLWDWEEQFCDEPFGNLTGKERVLRLNEKFGLKLSPAESRWQEHIDALFAFACDSCHQPTEQQYSVIAYDRNPVPDSFIQRKHICWKCVETGEFASRGLEIHEDDEFIVEMIQNGEMR
ncbi:MAG: hypothetical protein DRR19_26960 [Candidatus Parabeggiatoa sp. nov. 1]|nr:MAG: hypothetical protein DRR19_26960 [Gammaproteobacteria bacterium]